MKKQTEKSGKREKERERERERELFLCSLIMSVTPDNSKCTATAVITIAHWTMTLISKIHG